MANNPQQGGNSMAALLGNMRGQLGQPGQPQANYGAGLQAAMQPMQGGPQGNYGAGLQQATGAAGGQQPDLMGAVQGQVPQGAPPSNATWASALANQPTPGFRNPLAGTADSLGMPGGGYKPMPSFGAPGGGAAGKAPGMKQQIAQLQGGPQPGGLGGLRPMPRMGGGMRPRNPGMQPGMQNPMMRGQGR